MENIIKQLEEERDYSYEDYENYAEKHDIKIEGLDKPKSDISEGEEEEDY